MNRTLMSIALFVPFTLQCDPQASIDELPFEETASHQECGCDAAKQHADEPRFEMGEMLDPADLRDIEADDAPAWGASDAPVSVVLFADYACPYCARVVKTLHVVKADYGDRLRVVFRQLPLPIHAQAPDAARAALAAADMGKFDAYQQSLYAHPDAHDIAGLERLAVALDLDVTGFRAAFGGTRTAERLEADAELAKRLAVRGTPTMFVGGRRIIGAWPADKLRLAIDSALTEGARR